MGEDLYKWNHFPLFFHFHFSFVGGFFHLEIKASSLSYGSNFIGNHFNFTQNSSSSSSSIDDAMQVTVRCVVYMDI
jgi:hypothetical protein